jgi:hypothetical protein
MKTSTHHRPHRLAVALVTALGLLLPLRAAALCGCPSGGVPEILGSSMKGNDLGSVRGHCAPAGATVELQVKQQHFFPKPALPSNNYSPIWASCINGCQWITIASKQADPVTGHFAFNDLDRSQSVQLIASHPSYPGFDAVATSIRVRAWLADEGRWSSYTEPPALEAFDVAWDGNEGSYARVESRIANATRMHVTAADGPDDGDQPSVPLDVDEDTANFWLQSMNGTGTVAYSWAGSCELPFFPPCPSHWLIQQSPTITVNSPPLGRDSEYPFVLGMGVASRPGAMVVATRVLGPRDISDINVDVDVDVEVDVDIGINFLDFF